MNLTRTLKKEPFPSGVFTVRGPQGIGKTSFCAALLCADYKRWTKWRTEQGEELARKYYKENRKRLTISNRLYFCNIKILLDKRKKLYTHYVDVQRLGLPNPDYDVQYLPRGSVVFIQEADVLLFCRDFQTLNTYFINLMKYVRHNLLTIFFDCQVDGAIDAAIRRLTVGIYHIENSYTRRFFLFWKRRYWKFTYINNQLNELLKEVVQTGKTKKVNVVERGKFRFFGDIFKRYDSFSGQLYFLWGIEKRGYEYLPYPPSGYSIKDIQAFVEAHPLVRPESFKRGSAKNKGENNEQI